MRRKIRDGTVTLPHIQTVRKGGHVYLYARPPGKPRVRLPDLPLDHPEFLAAYAAAMSDKPKPVRASSGSIAALIETFRRSDAFICLSTGYKTGMTAHLEAIRRQAEDARAAHLRAEDIRADLAPLSPNIAASRLKAWRLICVFGKEQGLLAADPSEGIRRKRLVKTDGFVPWSDDQVDAYRDRWAIGTVQRLCMEVVFWSAARISDACLIGEGMIGRDGVLCFKQQKTGDETYVPWTCALPRYAAHLAPDRDFMLTALAARTKRHMTFLATAQGRTRSHKAIGNLISEAADAAGFDRSAHGLRKSRAISLAEGGATTLQIAAWTGHATLAEVDRYTKKMDRRRAVTGTEQEENSVNFSDPAKNKAKM